MAAGHRQLAYNSPNRDPELAEIPPDNGREVERAAARAIKWSRESRHLSLALVQESRFGLANSQIGLENAQFALALQVYFSKSTKG